ncbi:MAG: peptidoglycan DD-metalloendopeptidase family protein, partial [Tomitella sp.]|nr:peptidoglycan DD-metalloendopeptidase family protein [Tomitella sp.]
MSSSNKTPAGGGKTPGGASKKVPAGGTGQGGKVPAGGGQGLRGKIPAGGGAGAGTKRAAAVAVDTAAKSAIGAATGGVGTAIYGILPKPTDPKPVRDKKKRRLLIAGVAAASAILLGMLSSIVVALSLFGAIFGGAGGGAAGASSTVMQGECRSFSVPRLSVSGGGAQAGVLGLPVDEQFLTVSSGFGGRSDPFGGGGESHGGVDFAAAGVEGSPVYAVADGVVQPVNPDPGGYGNFVVVRHDLNGEMVDTLYGHMRDAPMVNPGDHVTAGQQVGAVGSTGSSTGAHLHFGVYPGGYDNGAGSPVDPMPWLSKFKGAPPESGGSANAPTDAADTGAPAGDAAGAPTGASPYPIEAGAHQDQQLNPEQQANLASIIAAARESSLEPPARAAVIAATLAGQATDFTSETGADGGPVGVFAERPLGDTSGEKLTDPKNAADGFYTRLAAYAEQHPDWAVQPVQDVIVGVLPERASMRDQYPQWEQLAVNTVTGMWEEESSQAGALQPIVAATALDPSCAVGALNGELATDQVPPQYVDILVEAGNTCPEIPAAQIAGITQQESGWNENATSGVGAGGLTQFMPGTWASYGVDSGLDKSGQPESGTTAP